MDGKLYVLNLEYKLNFLYKIKSLVGWEGLSLFLGQIAEIFLYIHTYMLLPVPQVQLKEPICVLTEQEGTHQWKWHDS